MQSRLWNFRFLIDPLELKEIIIARYHDQRLDMKEKIDTTPEVKKAWDDYNQALVRLQEEQNEKES
jgi:hypothetical protein